MSSQESRGFSHERFKGSGTTAKVAKELDRNYIGFELSNEYCKIARERVACVQGKL